MAGEFELIKRYFEAATPPRGDVLLGIGDDCALLQVSPGKALAVTTDTLVSGRHFEPRVNPESLGHKALAVNLSDLAAMGAEPAWASLALTLPEIDESWLRSFMRGFARLAQDYGVTLVGGDTTAGPLSISITVQGFLDPELAMRRDSARVGDSLYVSGTIGDAGLALRAHSGGETDKSVSELEERLDRPTPRVSLGLALRGVSRCAIDVSDGLGADLGHICDQSGVGALIEAQRLPLSPPVRGYVEEAGDWLLPLASGDDYELLFTVSQAQQIAFERVAERFELPLSRIGRIVPANEGLVALRPDGKRIEGMGKGYDHFRT